MDNIDTDDHSLGSSPRFDGANQNPRVHEPPGPHIMSTDGHAQERSTTISGTTTASSEAEDEDTPERLELIKSALAAHNKMAVPPGDPKESSREEVKQSSKERAGDPCLERLRDVYQKREASFSRDACSRVGRLCSVTDEIIDRIVGVEAAMMSFQQYIKDQNIYGKPLFKWAKFDYQSIHHALVGLDHAVSKFEATHLPPSYVRYYLGRATRLSLTVSQIAVFAMGVISEKTANCVDEIEESLLSAVDKANAQTLITSELQNLLKWCANATSHVYAALDLLRNTLCIDDLYQNPDIPITKEIVAESDACLATPRKSFWWNLFGFVFGAAASAAIGLTAAHLYHTDSFDLAPKANLSMSDMHSQVLDLIHRTQAIANIAGEIHTVKLEDLSHRYNELAEVSEAHGLRIDNLVEALGVPNEHGTYFLPTQKSDSQTEVEYQIPEDIHSYLRRISEDADRRMERLHNEMELMRRNVNLMDIRLTKRVDKVDHYSM